MFKFVSLSSRDFLIYKFYGYDDLFHFWDDCRGFGKFLFDRERALCVLQKKYASGKTIDAVTQVEPSVVN